MQFHRPLTIVCNLGLDFQGTLPAMLNADPLSPRPTLVHAGHLAQALDGLRSRATTPADMWRMLTDHYTVDLDAVAALLPVEAAEPIWLAARD